MNSELEMLRDNLVSRRKTNMPILTVIDYFAGALVAAIVAALVVWWMSE